MKYLNLSGNMMRLEECTNLKKLIVKNQTLEFLDISNCQIRGSCMSLVLDSLISNASLQTLKMADNSFASKDNLLASKLGRLLQGHPRLLHVDLSRSALLRADVIYACWCLRDSPNILSIHLTGNLLGHHDRILIQALLAARI